jgi:hypothetical protein
MNKIKELMRMINRLTSQQNQSGYWIRKTLVYGMTALLFVIAIVYALKRPYLD